MASIFSAYKDDDGTILYNLYNSVNIEGDIDPSLYTEIYMTDSDDWYTLSHKYYNTTYLWWIILVANKIVNPLEPYIGKLKILKSGVVSEILNQMTTIS